jgi:hypothetical protein
MLSGGDLLPRTISDQTENGAIGKIESEMIYLHEEALHLSFLARGIDPIASSPG